MFVFFRESFSFFVRFLKDKKQKFEFPISSKKAGAETQLLLKILFERVSTFVEKMGTVLLLFLLKKALG